MDLIVREVTTLPGIVNLIGAIALLRVQPAAGICERILTFVLVLDDRRRVERAARGGYPYVSIINRLTPVPRVPETRLAAVATIFIAYNTICLLLVSAA